MIDGAQRIPCESRQRRRPAELAAPPLREPTWTTNHRSATAVEFGHCVPQAGQFVDALNQLGLGVRSQVTILSVRWDRTPRAQHQLPAPDRQLERFARSLGHDMRRTRLHYTLAPVPLVGRDIAVQLGVLFALGEHQELPSRTRHEVTGWRKQFPAPPNGAVCIFAREELPQQRAGNA